MAILSILASFFPRSGSISVMASTSSPKNSMRTAFESFVHGEDLDHVAPHAERAAVEVQVVALVLDLHQLGDDVLAIGLLADLEVHELVVVGLGAAQAVDAAHAGDDDHVLALQQRPRRRVAHAVDLLVDAGVLLDVRVRGRHVGLGLEVVVITDEVLDGVVREELLNSL
jgi:hypothetical protein